MDLFDFALVGCVWFVFSHLIFCSPGQSFCHHLASVVRRMSYTFTFKSSPLKPLNQTKPNLVGMVLGLVAFKIVSDRSALHSRWLLLLKIEISSLVHCCFIINLNELKFLLQLLGNEYSLTYIPGFSVKFFFQPIYTEYAN